MRRLWIVVAGVLALGVVAALALVGVAPDGGHAWIDSIQTAMNCAVDKVSPTGGHAWID
jgi:hypothetical protein